MSARSLYNLLVAILCILMLVSCVDVEPEEVKFKVISYSGNFYGSYSVDSGSTVSFSGSGLGNNSYIFEKEVEVDNQLEVEADSADVDSDGESTLTSLEIKVYRDDSLIKSVKSTTDPVQKISLVYTTGESAESE